MKQTLREWCLKNNRQDLLDEWDYEKNGDITPDTVSKSSNKKVWWKCKEGHEWQANINTHSSGNNCPICSNQKILNGYNDFVTWCKQNNKEYLLKEWDYEKNKDITPDTVTAHSCKKIWWRCKEGHEWEDSLAHRTGGRGCPYCSHRRKFPDDKE